MKLLLDTLYDILCYITEDAVANRLLPNRFPSELLKAMNDVANLLGEYLDKGTDKQ